MPKKQEQEATEAVVVAPVADEAVVVVEAPAEVAYYYLPEKNPLGASLPGVPLCDLLTTQVERYPKHIQRSIKGSPMYKSASASADGEGDKE